MSKRTLTMIILTDSVVATPIVTVVNWIIWLLNPQATNQTGTKPAIKMATVMHRRPLISTI